MFTFKSPVNRLFTLINKDVLSHTTVMFPDDIQSAENVLAIASKKLKRDVRCWIYMLHHHLIEEEDIFFLIKEKKDYFHFDLLNYPGIDAEAIDQFTDQVCWIIYVTIITSYKSVLSGSSILSLFFSIGISTNTWRTADDKSLIPVL